MARLVVLEFDDNEAADQFVKYIDKLMYENDNSQFESVTTTTVGVFALPTQFCEGSLAHGCTGYRRFGKFWLRGEKFGWWVCRVCKKPARPKSKDNLIRNIVSTAVNLLTPEVFDPPTVFDAGVGAHRNMTPPLVPDSWRELEPAWGPDHPNYVQPEMKEPTDDDND